MLVRDAMSTVVLTIGPAHTLRQAARLMAARRVGAAVVLDGDSGLGILTERDILNAVASPMVPVGAITEAWELRKPFFAPRRITSCHA
ncbi:CBS domain-containing protein, partial [Streptomyces sp. NPDC047968]|uniref:CBS domain-containing protein n=1 Tax=Streptomyces sp. NPDC047968 TaxID=3155382 RepID=UPI0034448873